MSRPLLPPKNPELTVTPNSFVDPEIGAQATQDALLENLYSARLYGWKVRAPLKGPDDPALYQIVKAWTTANKIEGLRPERRGILGAVTQRAMQNYKAAANARSYPPPPLEIDFSKWTNTGVHQYRPSDLDLAFKSKFEAEVEFSLDALSKSFRDTVDAQNAKTRTTQLYMALGAVAVIGGFFWLRRKK